MQSLSFAVICSSNMNRSMEAHSLMERKGFRVKSFGTGDRVKLPGKASKPNCYEFGVSYIDIFNDLAMRDKEYYWQNGVLSMLMRNHKVKPCAQRFQAATEQFDVIITCEKRVYDQVIEWFAFRRAVYKQGAHIINIDIKDNLEEAMLGSFLIVDLATKLCQSTDLNTEIQQVLQAFEAKCKKPVMHCLMYY